MKQQLIKYSLITLIVLTGIFASVQAETKIYIGTEKDQFIVGIESMVLGVDAGAGLEIRTYFAKKGLIIDGVEYGHLPAKTVYTATAAGKTDDGNFARYKHNWIATLDGSIAALNNTIEVGYGQGGNLLTH